MKYCVIVKYVYSWKGLWKSPNLIEINLKKKEKKNEDINSRVYALIQLLIRCWKCACSLCYAKQTAWFQLCDIFIRIWQ